MCTVVCRWDPPASFPVQLLALRDERRRRDFDLPGAWWPQAPTVIGGRDRQAGGSWCVSDPATGRTAIVLNRPERRDALPGAPSRGALPLLALDAGPDWLNQIAVENMAGFNLVLVGPAELRWWSFNGQSLESFTLAPATYLFKPQGLVTDQPDSRLRNGAVELDDIDAGANAVWGPWLDAVNDAIPTPDGSGLLTRHPLPDGDSYETVFGQFIAARPGTLRVDYLLDPAARGAWTTMLVK